MIDARELALFVGGPWDGQRRIAASRVVYAQNSARYVRLLFADPDGSMIAVYVSDDVSSPLKQLVNGYAAANASTA